MYYLNECDKIQPAINSTTYTIKSMTRLIKKYHECLNLEYTIENEKDLKQNVSIGIIPQLNQSNLSYTSRPTPDNDAYIENSFKSNMYLSFGLFLKLSSTKVSPRMAIVFEPTIYQLEYTDKTNEENVSQKYLSFQIPLIVSYNLIGKSKNSMPLEIGVSYTSILNNPQSSTQYSPILTANFDFIGGLNYNFAFSNTKQLGIHLRYYYGISNVYQPYNYTGKRNRFGLGLSYELFKN